jgi:hypothetical protein
VPGTLISESGSFRLVVHDSLRAYEPPEPEEGVVEHTVGGPELVSIPVVHGYTRDRKPVTIFNAVGTDFAGPFEVVQESYDIDIALIGGHVGEDEFSDASVQFDWLDAWLQPPSLTGDGLRLDMSIVDEMPIDLHRVQLGADAVVFKVQAVGTHSASAVHLDRSTSIAAIPAQPASWRVLLNDWVRPMQDLLTIAIGRTVQMNWIHFRPATPDQWHPGTVEARFRAIQSRPLHFGPTEQPASSTSLHSYSAPTLFTAKNVGALLPDIVAAWVSNWRDDSAIVALLVAHMYAPFMYTAHQYGSIFQAVEGLHSTLFPGAEKSRAEHRERVEAIIGAARSARLPGADIEWAGRILQSRNDKSLAQRVEEVVRSTGVLGDAIMTASPTFAETAAQLRGSVAHPKGGDRPLPTSAQQYWHGDILSWVARTILLSRAGLPDAYERAERNAVFRHALGRLQQNPD